MVLLGSKPLPWFKTVKVRTLVLPLCHADTVAFTSLKGSSSFPPPEPQTTKSGVAGKEVLVPSCKEGSSLVSGSVTCRESLSFLKAQVRPRNSALEAEGNSAWAGETALTGEIVPTPSTFAIADALGVREEL